MLYFSAAGDWGVLDEFVGIGYVRFHEGSYTDAVLAAERLSGRFPAVAAEPTVVEAMVGGLLGAS